MRWLSFIVGLLILGLCMAVFVALRQVHMARLYAARYLGIVVPLPINAPYNAVMDQMRSAGLAITLTGDCSRDCSLSFLVGDEWLYKLHLAPPMGFSGRLDFRNGLLVYKRTGMGQDVMVWSAEVSEGTPPFGVLTPGLHGTQDSSGNVRHLFVSLSPADSAEYREKAYAFNLTCIGSIRGCKADKYLPLGDLRRLRSQRAPTN